MIKRWDNINGGKITPFRCPRRDERLSWPEMSLGSYVSHDLWKDFPVILSWSCPKGLKSVCGHKNPIQNLHLNLPNATKWNAHFKAQITASINLVLPKHTLIGMFRRCHRKAYNIFNGSKKKACLSQEAKDVA